jgi:predicted amidohydrolase
MRLAIYQGAGIPGAVDPNLERLAQTAAAAQQQAADLLILPELFLTGYNIGEAVFQLAQTPESAVLKQVAAIARHHQLAVLVGYPERSSDAIYNSAALIDATGTLIANYRKTHLFGAEERRLFTPGDRWAVHSIAGMKVGILICFDVEFPEAVRALAAQGAELIAVPTANMFPYTLIPSLVVPTRALENQVFVAYVNRIGTEGTLTYCGMSCVVAPNGKLLVQAGLNEALLVTEIARSAIEQERTAYCYLSDRRLKLYS